MCFNRSSCMESDQSHPKPADASKKASEKPSSPIIKNQKSSCSFSTLGSPDSFPPGYRFIPEDEELILYYLINKIKNRPMPCGIIQEANIYKHNPYDLTENNSDNGLNTWYFFTPRERKYRNGSRPNRAAGGGYWKATGADKPIHFNGKIVGHKKSLVFYEGKPPKGNKTNWIMQEYRVDQPPRVKIDANDMMLDDSVLCKIYKKDDKPLRHRRRRMICDQGDKGYDSHEYPSPTASATQPRVDGDHQLLNNVQTINLNGLTSNQFGPSFPQPLNNNTNNHTFTDHHHHGLMDNYLINGHIVRDSYFYGTDQAIGPEVYAVENNVFMPKYLKQEEKVCLDSKPQPPAGEFEGDNFVLDTEFGSYFEGFSVLDNMLIDNSSNDLNDIFDPPRLMH